MKRVALFTSLVLAGLVWAADDKNDSVVDLDGMKSKAPSSWVSEKPSNDFRYAQFRLPKAEGDKDDADIVIFKNLGGSNKDNFDRWKKTFAPPEGKKIDDIVKESKIKVGNTEADVLQLEGTFKYRAKPGDPNSKEELRPDYKFYGVIVTTKNNAVFHIKFTGPTKTVDKYEKGFKEWLESFK